MQHEKSDETQKIAAKRNEWKRENDDDGDHHQIIKYMSVVFPTSNRPAEAHQFRSKKRTKLHVIIPMIGPDSDRKVGGAARRFRGRPIGTPRRLMTQSDTRNSLEFILGKKIRRDLNFFFFRTNSRGSHTRRVLFSSRLHLSRKLRRHWSTVQRPINSLTNQPSQ